MTAKRDLYGGRDPREMPAYTIREASHYVRVPVSTLAAWVVGRPYQRGDETVHSSPLIHVPEPKTKTRLLSFSNLVEAFVLAAIRREHGVPLPKVRKALAYVGEELGVERPLVHERFSTDGKALFVERWGKLMNASTGGDALLLSAFDMRLRRIEFDEGKLASRLYPWVMPEARDARRSVVIDPRVGFGRPVLAGTGIPTNVVAGRWQAGEPLDSIATDYGVPTDLLEDALRCELAAAA